MIWTSAASLELPKHKAVLGARFCSQKLVISDLGSIEISYFQKSIIGMYNIGCVKILVPCFTICFQLYYISNKQMTFKLYTLFSISEIGC